MKPISKHDIKTIDCSDDRSVIFYAPKGLILSVNSKRVVSLCKKIEKGLNINHNSVTYKNLEEVLKDGPKPICRTKTKGFRSIILNISGRCNFKCPYCFARNDDSFSFDDFTSSQAFEVIDYCLSHGPKFEEYYLFFFGGEPLLNFEVMVDTIEYINQKYGSVKFRYGVTTNGSIISDEIIKILKQYNINTLLSFDGLDNNRPLRNGLPSTAMVLDNIKKLKENRVPLVIRTTLLTTSPNIFENIVYLESLGINFEYAFVFATGSEETNLSDYTSKTRESIKIEFDKIIDYYSNVLSSNQEIHCLTILEALTEINFKIQSHFACSAGSSSFTFNNNGDIYSCQNNASGKILSCGNIHTGLSKIKLRASAAPHYSRIDGCASCWIRFFCSGGCLSEKLMTGMLKTQNNKEKCDFERMKWEAYIRLTSIISESNPEYFERLLKRLENRTTLE